MSHINTSNVFTNIKSGIIVSLVALPLCLGIAITSGAPVLSGLIAGVIGGIFVGILSDSPLSVCGPAAGLSMIILTGIGEAGSFQNFLPAIVFAGVIQFFIGKFKAGVFSEYIPLSVIEGMMVSIGILIMFKQIPYVIGHKSYDDLYNIFIAPREHIRHLGAVIIGLASIILYISLRKFKLINHSFFKVIPFPLFLITLASVIALIFRHTNLELPEDDYVHIKEFIKSYHPEGFFSELTLSNIFSVVVFKYSIILAIVASIESLLSIQAADKLDHQKRKTDKNRELKVQGIGNIISGLLGGLPITSVVVRSSANAQAGATTKVSTITHGFILLLAITLFPTLIENAPISALAAILIFTGFNLSHPKIFKQMYSHGSEQFIPFISTIAGVLLLDLLKGVAIGAIISILFALRDHYHIQNKLISLKDHENEEGKVITFGHHLTFIDKKGIIDILQSIEPNSKCELNFQKTHHIDYEAKDIILQFINDAPKKDIRISINPKNFIK